MLSPGTIDVWRVPTRAGRPADGLRSVLSPDEVRRASRLADPRARVRFVHARAALRLLLARYTGDDPAALDLAYGVSGKPSLRAAGADAPGFSVSHAGDLALLAFARGGDVGVDLERIRPPRHADRIAARLFDRATCALLGRLADEDRVLAFYHAWTQREAFVKAVGGTLFATHDPLAFRWPRPRRQVQRVAEGASWTVAALEPGPGYVATVVAQGSARRIVERDWDPTEGGDR